MSSLLAKFSKSSQSGGKSDRSSSESHRRASTEGSPAVNPQLVLIPDDEADVQAPFTPGSIHRPYSIPDPYGDSSSLSPMKNSSSRRAMSLVNPPGPNMEHVPEDDDLTPGPGGRRPFRPSREVPELPTVLQNGIPRTRTTSVVDLPANSSVERRTSSRRRNSQSRSRRDSSSHDGHNSLQPLVDSPPGDHNNGAAEPLDESTGKPKPRKTSGGWGKRTASSGAEAKKRPSMHPSGGLASAIAASGLAMANPAMQQPPPTAPAPSTPARPPAEQKQDRHHATASYRKPSTSGPPEDSMGGNEDAIESDEEEDDDYNSDDSESSHSDLDFRTSNLPVMGFAVASNKRTQDFHALFPTVPEADYLIDDYGCALQREILIQGRLYASENHLCFHANIFGWTTDLVIPFEDVINIDKRMTAYVIPNAIQVTTKNAKYTFASLLTRDTTYDVFHNLWRVAHPGGLPDAGEGSVSASVPNSPRGSLDINQTTSMVGSTTEGGAGSGGASTAAPDGKARGPTQCLCGKEGKHLTETALDAVIPGAPEKIYNLMFASGWMKDFMRDDQKLTDIQVSDWTPLSPGSTLLTRNMSYIKPLAGGLGPKQTKCELKDETVHLDYDDYVTMITTTRTPDVPSGGVFSVKTRTCLTWAGQATTRVLITCQVEWTGRSFIKSIIEKSALEGQRTYATDLERALRAYIAAHKSEFAIAGAELDDADAVDKTLDAQSPSTPAPAPGTLSQGDLYKAKEQERDKRALQWALDTVEGTAKVAKQSFSGALELVYDAWDNSSTTGLLWLVVVLLVGSNLWTYLFWTGRAVLKVKKPGKVNMVKADEIQNVVGESMREAILILERAVKGDAGQGSGSGGEVLTEVQKVSQRLEMLEARFRRVEGMLKLDAVD